MAVTTDRPKQKRAVRTRRRILKAALLEFAEKGYEGATTRGIARRARVESPLLHYHFRTKNDLWKATAEQSFSDMHSALDAAVKTSSHSRPIDVVRMQVRALVAYSSERPEFIQFVSNEWKNKSRRTTFLVNRFFTDRYASAIEAIQLAQSDGHLPCGDARVLNLVILTLGTSIASMAARFEILAQRSINDSSTVEEYSRMIDELIFKPPATKR